MVKQTACRCFYVQRFRVCVTVDVDVCVGKCESLSQRTLLVHGDRAVRVVHDQFSVNDGSRAATTQTFAVHRVGIDTVQALAVVVRQVVHAVDDRFLHLLFPHIDALRRVGFAPEQRRAVHTIGAEVVLPRNIGTRRWHLHSGVGQCRGLCRCARCQAVTLRCHGTYRCLKAYPVVGCHFEGNDLSIFVDKRTGCGIDGRRHVDLYRLSRSGCA